MKKNISINISGIIFHIEEDGYETLKNYLESINTYFSSYEESEEIIADIEGRIAEIFLERLSDGQQVVSAQDVSDLMKTMGNTTDFEAIEDETDFAATSEPKAESTEEKTQGSTHNQANSGQSQSTRSRTLQRDLKNQTLGGVASGIAHYFNIDSIWVRIAFILFLPAGGISLLAYFILWVVVPGSNNLEENSSIKKLYRDPGDRVLGGVCSGLATFLKIDTIIVRIIFILLLIGGGTGLIAYLILWAITPEANSITDKMQMKGEKVTLSNIDENIKKQKSEEDFGPKDEGAFTKILLFPFRLIGKIFSSLSKALAPLMLFIVAVIRVFTGFIVSVVGLALMFSMLVTAGVLLGLYNGDYYYINDDLTFIPYDILEATVPLVGLIAFIIVMFVPFFYVFIAGITIIAKRKVMSSSVGWSVLGVWLIAILVMAATVPNVVRDFRDEGSITYSETIDATGNTLILDIDPVYDYRRNNDLFIIDLDIRASKDSTLTLDSRVRSRGRNVYDAEENAKMIEYDYSVRDSVITFEDFYHFERDGKYRAQELEMTLYIPEGQPFRVKRGMDELLGYFNRGYRWSEIYRNTWVFQNGSLECMTCSSRSSSSSSSASRSNSSERTIDLPEISSIELKEAFQVSIQYGTTQEVTVKGDKDLIDRVVAYDQAGTYIFEADNLDESETDDIEISITIPTLERLLVRDEVNARIAGLNENRLKLSIQDDARVEFDGRVASMDISVEEKGRLTIVGDVDKLTADLRNDAKLYCTDGSIQTAEVNTYSDARARLKVDEYLRVDARGFSSVRYTGSPELDIVNKSRSAVVGVY
ncbi:MAG: PspC domain-containing protein [Roseivirga sp.]|nr:PspC domain-containing protein [Roseivirga sp.]